MQTPTDELGLEPEMQRERRLDPTAAPKFCALRKAAAAGKAPRQPL